MMLSLGRQACLSSSYGMHGAEVDLVGGCQRRGECGLVETIRLSGMVYVL